MANLSAAKLRRQSNRSHSDKRSRLAFTSNPTSEDEGDEELTALTRALIIKAQEKEVANAGSLTTIAISVPLSKSQSKPKMATQHVRLLIASLGNPFPYQTTRHSAGHILLKSLSSYMGFGSLTKSKPYAGSVSVGSDAGRPEYTLWQSPSLMNVSGNGVSKAWKHFLMENDTRSNDTTTALVILHDELETQPGQLKVRRGQGSARGHNGLKSIQSSMQSSLTGLGDRFIKIGIGIGRPASRERDDVSNWVLSQLTASEMAKIEGTAPQLFDLLQKEIQRMEQN